MIRNDIKALAAYHVPDSGGMIKLDAMENPYNLPDEVRQEWLEKLALVDLNRYPDSNMLLLRQKIAARDGVEPEQVLLGNGSDEIIQMLLLAMNPGTCVVPRPTFVMYDMVSRWLKRPVASVPLKDDFSLDADYFLQVCGREKAEIAFLACPNNPTGNLWDEAVVQRIARGMSGHLIIDEAYGPFSEHSYTSMISTKVMVLRTFSKLGWAALRLGYLLGDAEQISQLNKVRMPYNINGLTQASALFLLDKSELFEQQAAMICAERERVFERLSRLDQVTLFPSKTNFLLLRVPDAGVLFDGLKKAGILIKNMHGSDPLLTQCVRITIGSKEENSAVIAVIEELLR
ncbi:MAG: histidinol-phosphate transaminase [Mariprofundus sp.]|nr:histidinol-phosphate transaminase [Mariprofundus sp.]